jgi:hypothetical protein
MSELAAIGRFLGEHGPYVAVIMLLLRSLARKDAVIENLTSKTLDLIHQTRGAAQAATAALRHASDKSGDPE